MNTRNKRASAIGFALASLVVQPTPDAALAQADRQHIAWSYAGISAGAIPDFIRFTDDAYTAPAVVGEGYALPALTGEAYAVGAVTGESYVVTTPGAGSYASPSVTDEAYQLDEDE